MDVPKEERGELSGPYFGQRQLSRLSATSACGRKCPETCRQKCNYSVGASDPASASGLTLTVTPLRSRVVSSGFPGTSTRRLR
jgi:hypothetical protein